MKAQGARTMAAIATKLGASLGPPHLGAVLTALLGALPGRTWTGKVSVAFFVSVFTRRSW